MSQTLTEYIPLIPLGDVFVFVWFMALWGGYTLIADRQGAGQRLVVWLIGPVYLAISTARVVEEVFRRGFGLVLLRTLSEQVRDANPSRSE